MMADDTSSLHRIGSSDQDDDYSQPLCSRYQLSRPLPKGKRVYFTLLQFILLSIVSGTTEVYFQVLLNKYYSGEASLQTYIFFRSFPLLLCLPMGFIADRYFGRAKVIYYSWIFLFIAQLLLAFYTITDALDLIPHTYRYVTSVVGLLINSISLAGIQVNLIPFGADQMKTASSDQLSSYFHWYYWCRNVGLLIAFSVGASLIESSIDVAALFVSSTAAAAGAMINFVGYKWFIRVEKISNPLLLVYQVLKYAATVKRPAERTAFSYDGRPVPSRIDLAKATHFGKFSDEEVEDVKTFLRIIVFLISLTGFLCVYSLVSNCVFCCYYSYKIWRIL